MKQSAIFVLLTFALVGCSLGTSRQSSPSDSTDILAGTSSLPQGSIPADSSYRQSPETSTASHTPEPSETFTPTLPPTLTPTLTIHASATSYQDPFEAYLMGSMADLTDVSQYFDPTGTPLDNWHDISIMPQAFAGQEFKVDIYSYKANATLTQAIQFYQGEIATLDPTCFLATGYSGTGINAMHNAIFKCRDYNLYLTSYDNDTKHVIVVINKLP